MHRIIRVFLLVTLFALGFGISGPVPVQAAGTWEPVGSVVSGNGDANHLSLAIDSGIPYAAYTTYSYYSDQVKITLMKFDGTDWIAMGDEYVAPNYVYDLSLDVDDQTPYVAYSDWDFKPTVLKFNGVTWEVVGVAGFSDGEISNLSPIVVENGTPYVAYSEWTDDQNSDLYTVKKFDGTNWVSVGTPNASTTSYGASSLVIDNGVLYLAFSDAAQQNKATVMKFDGTDWVTVGAAGISRSDQGHISLALDNGIPYIAYQEYDNNFKVIVKKFNGSDWVEIGVSGISARSASDVSIEVNNGVVYAAFKDLDHSSRVTVMKFNGLYWVTVGLPGFTTDYIMNLNLELYNAVPYVAFTDQFKLDDFFVVKFNASTNSPPTELTLSNDRVPQNLPKGTKIGTLVATDADPNDPHIYSLTCAAPGPDDAFFKVGGPQNNTLQTNAVFDYNVKNVYNVCVRADDGSDGIYDKNFVINVTTTPLTKVSFRSVGANDGWVLEVKRYSDRGGLVNATEPTLRLGDSELDQEYRSILSFNTINIPDTAIITSVVLKIKKQLVVGEDPFESLGKLVVDVRSPYFGNSAAVAKHDFQADPGMSAIGDIPNRLASGWYRKAWLSDTFFSYINLKGHTQFRLHFMYPTNYNLSADYIAIYSGNYATVTDRPMLIIEYYVP